MKAKRFILHNDAFDTDFLIQIGGSINDLIKCFAKKLNLTPWAINDNPRRFGHFAAHRDFRNGCIWLNKDFKPEHLAHECFHATCHLFTVLETPITEATEELFAYTLQWMVSNILKRN